MTNRAEKQRRKQALREAELAHQARRQHRKHRWLNVLSSLCQLLGGACLLGALLLDAAWSLDAVWLSFALWTAAAWLSWYLAPGGTSSFVLLV